MFFNIIIFNSASAAKTILIDFQLLSKIISYFFVTFWNLGLIKVCRHNNFCYTFTL